MSRRAVIVSTARTGLTKSFRSGFNNTHGAVMRGHAIKHAIEKAGISPGDVEDVIIGCGFPEGATGMNIVATPLYLAPGCAEGDVDVQLRSEFGALAALAQALVLQRDQGVAT